MGGAQELDARPRTEDSLRTRGTCVGVCARLGGGLSVALAIALTALAAVPVAAGAARSSSYGVASPSATLARLNALRSSFGASPVRLVPSWSTGCADHMRYIAQNQNVTHG